jgi:hypothetical protein
MTEREQGDRGPLRRRTSRKWRPGGDATAPAAHPTFRWSSCAGLSSRCHWPLGDRRFGATQFLLRALTSSARSLSGTGPGRFVSADVAEPLVRVSRAVDGLTWRSPTMNRGEPRRFEKNPEALDAGQHRQFTQPTAWRRNDCRGPARSLDPGMRLRRSESDVAELGIASERTVLYLRFFDGGLRPRFPMRSGCLKFMSRILVNPRSASRAIDPDAEHSDVKTALPW